MISVSKLYQQKTLNIGESGRQEERTGGGAGRGGMESVMGYVSSINGTWDVG